MIRPRSSKTHPEVRLRAVDAPLRRASARAPPEADVGDLRHLPDVEHRPEQRMIEGQVDDRVLPGREHLVDLADPLRPLPASPEVVHPQKPPFSRYSRRRSASSSDSSMEPTAEAMRKGQPKSVSSVTGTTPVDRLVVGVEVDVGGRHLRQPDHEVDVGEGIVRRPAAHAPPDVLACVHEPAERVAGVALLRGAEAGADTGIASPIGRTRLPRRGPGSRRAPPPRRPAAS